jgi:uncharacterized protein with FMN-binding domain
VGLISIRPSEEGDVRNKNLTAVAVVVLVAVSGCAGSCSMPWDHSWVGEMEINDVNLKEYADGVYVGSFAYNRFEYVVSTTVQAHRYKDIVVVENRDTERAQMAEAVVERVVEYQTLFVDAVTGATNTSMALLKAIERGFN